VARGRGYPRGIYRRHGDVRKANLEVTEVGEITEEHTENELEEGERTQEKNQGAQEYQEEEATPPRREGE